MKNIKVLGSGCKNCETTARIIQIAADQAGVEIELEKVTDMAQIMGFGVMSTPLCQDSCRRRESGSLCVVALTDRHAALR